MLEIIQMPVIGFGLLCHSKTPVRCFSRVVRTLTAGFQLDGLGAGRDGSLVVPSVKQPTSLLGFK
jgi:hypothetical protein